MSSAWRRTRAEAVWSSHEVCVVGARFLPAPAPGERSGSQSWRRWINVPWDTRHWITGRLELAGNKWSYQVMLGNSEQFRGTAVSESAAKAAVMRRVRPMIENVKRLHPADPKWLRPGEAFADTLKCLDTKEENAQVHES